MKTLTKEEKELLTHFLDSLRDYERESNNIIGHDDRETSEFVEIYESILQHRPKTNNWVAVSEFLPEPLETVWLTNGTDWVALGCLVITFEGRRNEGWHWAQSNGVIYQENGHIISECESDDLDVVYWHKVPELLPNDR